MAVYLPSDGNWHEVASRSITVNGNVYITGKVFAKCWGESVANNTHYLQTKQVVYRSGYSLSGSGYSFECSYCATNSGSGVWTWESEEQVNGDSPTQTITHNADGTKTLNLYGFYYNNYWGISEWYSADVQLPTIPRASTPSIPSASDAKELGNAITISIARAASGFKHTLRIKDGDEVVETVGTAQAIDTSQSWTPAIATYAPRIINGETKTFTIECLTYNGTTHIGTKTCNVILKVPASQKPSVTISIAEANSSIPSSWGKYVKGLSKLTVTLSETLSYGAPITNRNITVEGSTYSTNPATTNTLAASGNVTATITDSRGHTSSTATKSYTVEDYAPPQITSAMIIRCNSNGTDNPDGNYMKYTFVGSISPVANKNTKSFKIQYKKRTSAGQTEDTWHDYYTYTGGYTVNQQSVVGNTQLSSAYTYDVKFVVADQFNTTVITKVLDTAFDLMNFHKSGRSIAFGKMSEAQDSDKLFECGLDADFKEVANFRKNITYKGYLLDSLLATAEIPVGTIMPFTSTSVPSGYMVCDGSAISRTTYAELFSVIGTTYGSGDGSTTFNLPNIKGRVVVGQDTSDTSFDTIAETGGSKYLQEHTHTMNRGGAHSHLVYSSFQTGGSDQSYASVNSVGNGTNNKWRSGDARATDDSNHTHTINSAGTGDGGNLQPYIVLVYMIKVSRGTATVPSSVTVTNADVAQITQNKNDITELKNKVLKVATAQMESNKTYAANYKYTMDSIISTTDQLTLYDGGIKIGSGISKVLVSAQAFAQTNTNSGYVWTTIMKNSTQVSISINTAASWFATVNHTAKLIDVVEGDVIYFYDAGSSATGTIRGANNTYLTVQVIE